MCNGKTGVRRRGRWSRDGSEERTKEGRSGRADSSVDEDEAILTSPRASRDVLLSFVWESGESDIVPRLKRGRWKVEEGRSGLRARTKGHPCHLPPLQLLSGQKKSGDDRQLERIF